MGLPVQKFIAAVNENDEFPKFLEGEKYSKIEPSKACLSNAMNVGHPSNLARIIDLYGGHLDEKGILKKTPNMDLLRQDIWSVSISDEKTKETIKNAYEKTKAVFEPHGAVGWAGLLEFENQNGLNYPWCVLETADPAKFPDQIVDILGIDPKMPEKMVQMLSRSESNSSLNAKYDDFKQFLLKKYK
jgi:threonine synthase